MWQAADRKGKSLYAEADRGVMRSPPGAPCAQRRSVAGARCGTRHGDCA
jgi:hypothetical protein